MLSFRSLAPLALGLFIAIAALFTPLTAHAADPSESITLSPVKKMYQVAPGQVVNDSLTVLNDGTTPYTFTVYATPYSVENEAYSPNFTATKANADAYTWVQFSQTSYHADPRQTITVPFSLHVSKNALPGGHYGAIFVEVQPTNSNDNSSVVFKKRAGTLLYATVSGGVHLSGSTTAVTTSWLQTHPPLTTNVLVKNTGNSDFAATITYTVSDIFGNPKYTSQNDYQILPQTTRDITLQWAQSASFGLYKVTTASTVLGHTVTASSYLLMMPIWLMLLVAIIIIGGIVYAVIAHKHHVRKKTRS